VLSASNEMSDAEYMFSERARARSSTCLRILSICACLAELAVLVPNLLLELELNKGLYAPVLRILLGLARASPLSHQLLSRMGRFGTAIRQWLQIALPSMYSTACGGVEPCRGLATALSGWYLITTPMHDAFSPESELSDALHHHADEGLDEVRLDEALLLPCAVVMSVNVFLFLCDALALTVLPLFKNPESIVVPLPCCPRAQGFVFGQPGDIDLGKFDPTCVICLTDFELGEPIAHLPCGHIFHSECVNHWLLQHGSCPLRCPGLVMPSLELGCQSEQTMGLEEAIGTSSPRDSDSSISLINDHLAPSVVGLQASRLAGFGERPAIEPPGLPSAVDTEEASEVVRS